MISLNKINPLNILNAREVDHPPPYFQFLTLDLKYNIVNTIKDWINQNLKHRYYINETLVIVDGQYQVRIKIGFEDPKEASFFLLACSHLKYCSN